jgi:hypothetical protein
MKTFVAYPEAVLSLGIGLEGLPAQSCVDGVLDLLQCQSTTPRDRRDLRSPSRLARSLPHWLRWGLHAAGRNLAGHRSVTPATNI